MSSPIPHPCRRLAVTGALLAGVLAGCSGGEPPPAAQAPPASASAAAPAPQPAPPQTTVLSDARKRFTAAIPARFTPLSADAPEVVNTDPRLAQAARSGSAVLAVDRSAGATSPSRYSPTIGGICSTVPSQDPSGLATDLRGAVAGSSDASPPPEFTAGADGRVNGRYQLTRNGVTLQVTQVAALAGPGRACVLTLSTDDAARDAAEFAAAVRTFTVPRIR